MAGVLHRRGEVFEGLAGYDDVVHHPELMLAEVLAVLAQS